MSPLYMQTYRPPLRTRIRGPPEKSTRTLKQKAHHLHRVFQPKTRRISTTSGMVCVHHLCCAHHWADLPHRAQGGRRSHHEICPGFNGKSAPPFFSSWLAPIMAKLFQAWSCFFDDWLGVFCTWASEGRHFFSFDYQSPNAPCMESLFTFTINFKPCMQVNIPHMEHIGIFLTIWGPICWRNHLWSALRILTPSNVVILRTPKHPCVIQVRSPFHWRVQGFFGWKGLDQLFQTHQ